MQLHLDTDIAELALRHYMRWWIGSWVLDGVPPITLPSPESAGEGTAQAPSDASTEADPDAEAGASVLPTLPLGRSRIRHSRRRNRSR